MLVSQRIEQGLRQVLINKEENEHTLEETVFPLLRLATVLTCLSAKLLEAVLQQAGIKRRSLSLTELLFKEAQDPNNSSLAKIVVLRSDSIEEALHNRLEMPPFTGHLTGGAQDGLSMFGSMLSNDIGQG